jgi:hypothetical protein
VVRPGHPKVEASYFKGVLHGRAPPHAPEVEEAGAPGFGVQEDGDQQAHHDQRQRRGRRASRRLRRNYGWIFAIQAVSYLGKLLIHPEPVTTLEDLWARAAIGPVPGQLVLLCGLAFHGGWGGGRGRHPEGPARQGAGQDAFRGGPRARTRATGGLSRSRYPAAAHVGGPRA